eukprot:6068578-Pyramimonas_sp.AAC.1
MIGGATDGLMRACRSSVVAPASQRLGRTAGAAGGPSGIDRTASMAERPMAGCPAAGGAAGAAARFIARRACRA